MGGKYKLLNGYNDRADADKRRMSKRMETLSELARKMQNKNKDLSHDLKQAKTRLFNAGAVDLVWKSDPKPKEATVKEESKEAVVAEEAETVENGTADDAESEKVCDEEEEQNEEEQEATQNNEQGASNPNDQAATF